VSEILLQTCCKELIEIIEQRPGITYNDIVRTSKFNRRTLDAAIRHLNKTLKIDTFDLKGKTAKSLRLIHDHSII